MRSWTTPTREQVDQTAAKLAGPIQLAYFFEKLDNPEWIQPLRERGLLNDPPQPTPGEGKTLHHPSWPPIFYLLRMADDTRYATLIADILTSIATIQNLSVVSVIADTALKLPADEAAKVAASLRTWIRAPDAKFLHKDIGELAARLLEAGHTELGMSLVNELLSVSAPPEPEEHDALGIREPVSVVEPYWYSEILERLTPVLAANVGLPALKTLTGILSKVVTITHPRTTPPHDASHVWRPAVEDDEDRRDGIENSLVTAVRDVAVDLVKTGRAALPDVLDLLLGGKWNIHKRIGMHVLRIYADQAPDEVTRLLTDKETFDDDAFRHEYYLLAKHSYANLRTEDQERIVSLVLEGPYDLSDWEEYVRRRFQEEPNAEIRTKRIEIWRRDRLQPIVERLSPELQKLHATWVEKHGPSEHHERTFIMKSGWGPISPLKPNELAAKNDDELIQYLRDYKDEGDEFGGPEAWEDIGMARALQSVTETDPERFLRRRAEYAALRPQFVTHILEGFDRAAKAGKHLPWSDVLDFIERACSAESVTTRERRGVIETASLLRTSFAAGEGTLPPDLREKAWRLLEPLTRAEDPTPESEKEHGRGFGDLTTFSINTARGTALRSAIHYALWTYRALKTHKDEPTLTRDIPEARAALDARLDHDENPSIWTAFGELLPWLILMDRGWVRSRLREIFPAEPERKIYRRAAWTGYIQLGNAYNDAFDLIRSEYENAVDELDPDAREERRFPAEHLPEHLMALYWRGKIELDDADRLLPKFFERAPPWMRAHAINFIGFSLQRADEPIPRETQERLMRLYEWRLDEGASAEELEEFARWYASRKLDEEWSTRMLLKTLDRTNFGFEDYLVLEATAALRIPAATKLEVFEKIRSHDPDRMGFHRWEEPARTILGQAAASEAAATRDKAREIVNDLVAKGYLKFRDLYKPA